jgi:hypothetical protein
LVDFYQPKEMRPVLLSLMASWAAACGISFGAGGPTEPSMVAGMNNVMGPIVNLSYSDPALISAAHALNVGSFRHPGGTVANYWSIVNGSYVGADGTTAGCSNPPHWNYCNYAHRGTGGDNNGFSALKFADGVGANASIVYDLNVFSLSASDMLAQIDWLKQHNVQVARFELGNEFDHNQAVYRWRFPKVDDYLDTIKPVIAHIKTVYPKAKTAVVASHSHGSWNTALAARADELGYDAITVHDYSPNNGTITKYPADQQISAVAGWGDAAFHSLAQTLRKDWPKGVEVWRTEFNYPTWASGPPLPRFKDGALHGIYWASWVLAAVRSSKYMVNVPVLMVHAFLHQNGLNWDAENGLVEVGQQADDLNSVKVNGISQIFGHMSRAAMGHSTMHGGIPDGCPTLDFQVGGIANLSCVMAAGFFGDQAARNGKIRVGNGTVVLLNKCAVPITVSLSSPPVPLSKHRSKAASPLQVLSTITYDAHDEGGWAHVPMDPDSLPWAGPLSPKVQQRDGSETGSLSTSSVVLPPTSLTFAAVA